MTMANARRSPPGGAAFELVTHDSIHGVGEATWSELAADAPPFLQFSWLAALEASGCLKPQRGWLPLYVTLHERGRLVAAAPGFIKGNSEGEFVFDHSWARFSEARLHRSYYPKLVIAVPFTPATGPRLLVARGAERAPIAGAFAAGLRRLCEHLELSSAHVLFPPESEACELGGCGLVHRYGLQFHWRNAGYATFDDFLSRFSSKRRHQIRRERRAVREQGVVVEVLTGSAIAPAAADDIFELYTTTVDKFYWGRRYLNRGFFQEVCRRMPEQLMIVLARDGTTGRVLGGAFNLLGRRALYGRYWGAHEERPFLHFEVCYYTGIEQCILRGLELFEPGAGGEHKLARGFEPAITHSVHLMLDEHLEEAVRQACAHERAAIADHISEAHGSAVLKAR
jgi:predicted N-acyltransferase